MKQLNDLLNNTKDEYLINKLNILSNIYNNYINFEISYNVYEIALSNFRNDIMLNDEITNDNKLIFLNIINKLSNVL